MRVVIQSGRTTVTMELVAGHIVVEGRRKIAASFDLEATSFDFTART